LSVEGQASSDVAMIGNDLRLARAAWVKSAGFVGAVAEIGNLGAV
jgi:hypothetical protein